ncbi:terpene synthase family protein [Streptomyces laurentii]|uniref:terpene synthase family protein n=1 Tax=Streptomyces laurentii TaxID=39478 RepID=UPI00367BE931
MSIRFDVPPMYCPLRPPRPHPDEALLEKRGLERLGALGLFADPLDRMRAIDTASPELMARMTPGAPTELVQLGVDWSYLAFAFDDRRTDIGPGVTDTTSLYLWFEGLDYASTTLDTDGLPDDVFYTAVADLSARIKEQTTPELWRRWLTDNKATYWAALWEPAHRAGGQPAGFGDFLTVRPYLGLAPSALTCAEIAAGLRVPEDERHDPPVRAFVEAISLLFTLDNDVYSYPKEDWRARRAGRDSLAEPAPVPLLMREHGDTAAEAAHRLVRMRDRVMAQALRLAERIAAHPYSHDTHAMADIHLGAIRNHLSWSQHAPRYTNPDGAHPGAIDLRWAELTRTPPSNDGPLPYPAISWWWDFD